MRTGPHLPDGYHIEELPRIFRLYNPEGALLQEEPRGPAAVPRLQQRAWFDVWEHLEYEISEELRGLREGTRVLRDSQRLRQYLRMVDAIEGTPFALSAQLQHQVREQVRRSWLVSGLALATAAAAIALTLVTVQPWLAWGPEDASRGSRPAVSIPTVAKRSLDQAGRPAAGASSTRKALAGKPQPGATDRVARIRRPRRSPQAVNVPTRRRAPAAYVVGFGEFATRAAAEIRMRLVRSKGYVVHVVQIENSYHVLTAPRPQEQAERLASALQEIGLPARMQIVKTPQI